MNMKKRRKSEHKILTTPAAGQKLILSMAVDMEIKREKKKTLKDDDEIVDV